MTQNATQAVLCQAIAKTRLFYPSRNQNYGSPRVARIDRGTTKKSRPGRLAPERPPAFQGWGLRVPRGVARLVETFTMIGLGEKGRFFLGLFDRAYQWFDLSLATKKITPCCCYITTMKHFSRQKCPKNAIFAVLGFGGIFD
jgi:hypothetical protein